MIITPSETEVAAQAKSGRIGWMDGWCPGGVKYRTAYAANNHAYCIVMRLSLVQNFYALLTTLNSFCGKGSLCPVKQMIFSVAENGLPSLVLQHSSTSVLVLYCRCRTDSATTFLTF